MKPKRDERFAIRLSAKEKAALEKIAVERDATASQLIRKAIRLVIATPEERTR